MIRGRVIKSALLAGVLIATMVAPAVTATHWSDVEEVSSRTAQRCVDGTKIEIPDDFVNGTSFALVGGGTIQLWITGSSAGELLKFKTDSGHRVTSITVKGGPVALMALKYHYSGDGVREDSGLHSRVNDNNGKWYGVSFVCIESGKKDDDPKK